MKEEKPAALIAVLREELEVGGKALQAGFVGTVSVHPKARGEGHMKVLDGRMAEGNARNL